MIVSLNEVQSLATKAARGAGLEPSTAAHFGRAALLHLLNGRDWQDLRKALLDGTAQTLPHRLMEIVEAGGGRLDNPGPLAASYVSALVFDAYLAEDGLVTIELSKPAPKPKAVRCPLPDALRAQWLELAAKTFVPETAESRLSGAGAGLTDND